MALIFAASATSIPPDAGRGVPDKLVHAVVYAGLTLLLVRALAGGLGRPISGSLALAAVGIAAAYGITDEVHQAFVPTRQPDAADLLADVAGGAVAALSLLVKSGRAPARDERTVEGSPSDP